MSTFEQELQSMIAQCAQYEIPSNRAAALAKIPSDFLLAVAQAKCESVPGQVQEVNKNEVRDIYLLELMSWFKNEFFSWMDSPNCPRCKRSSTAIGAGQPSPDELAHHAYRVELFTCTHCFQDNREVARFPRYNHPAILLETRTGRCGEWANCFALICRAAGFEVRLVKDWTDHLWVEVFSCSLNPNRWVHADPCENSYDSPLLYEKGWSKKLSYVIACSQDDLQDVTWRYVQEENVKDVLMRRRLIEESRLVNVIMNIKQNLQANIVGSRKQILESRMIQELAEFLYPRAKSVVKESEMGGRESGSLVWRLARQELGSEDQNVGDDSGHIWVIGEERIFESKFVMTYDSIKDQYFVYKGNNSIETKPGWKAGARHIENIFRKEEHDWKMVYLARTEKSTKTQGKISWQFDLPKPTLQIKTVKILVSCTTFHPSANILTTLADENGNVYKLENKKTEGLFCWTTDEVPFQVCSSITLTCKLEGGEGATAWQHAQLFRANLNSNNSFCGLRVELDIVPKVL